MSIRHTHIPEPTLTPCLSQKRGYQSLEDSPTENDHHRGALGGSDHGHGGPVVKRQRADSDYNPNTPTYARAPPANYAYSGHGMTPGGYGAYPMYDSHSHPYHQDHDYTIAGMPESYPPNGQMMSNHFNGLPRQGTHSNTSIPMGSYQDLPSKHSSQSDQTSYFSGYPTPTKSITYNPHLQVQSSDLYGHGQIPQHQQFMPAGTPYGAPAGNTQPGNPLHQLPNAYPRTQVARSNSIVRAAATAPSQAYAVAAPTTEAQQAFDALSGFGSNNMLYHSVETTSTTGAMPSTPLTSSTLNSAYTGPFDDIKPQPPDQPPPAVYPTTAQGHHPTLNGVYSTR